MWVVPTDNNNKVKEAIMPNTNNGTQDYWSAFESVDEAKVQGQTPKFKMSEKDDKTRIHFPFVNPQTSQVALKKCEYFSFEDKATNSWARFQVPPKNSKAYKVALQHCGEPNIAYVTPILQYSTNNTGKVVSGIDYDVIALTLTRTRLKELKQIQEEYNLAEIDVGVVCQEPKYQNIKFSPLKRCALNDGYATIKGRDGLEKKLKLEYTREEVFAQAKECIETADLAIANRWSEQQILDFFLGDKSPKESATSEDLDYESVDESEAGSFDEDDEL